MPVISGSPAPYATTSSIVEILERYRHRGMQTPITAEVLSRSGVSESLVPRTLQSLRTLDLIDEDGSPTEALEGLRLAPEAEYQQRMQEWLKSAYADVFQYVDPAKDDETKVRDAFRTYTPTGQQGRMVLLFLGLCVASGLRAEQPKEPRKPRSTKSAPKVRTVQDKAPTSSRRAKPSESVHPPVASMGLQLHSALEGLLKSLPDTNGPGWTERERDRFLETFRAVLEFCYPVREAAEPARDEWENGDEG